MINYQIVSMFILFKLNFCRRRFLIAAEVEITKCKRAEIRGAVDVTRLVENV